MARLDVTPYAAWRERQGQARKQLAEQPEVGRTDPK